MSFINNYKIYIGTGTVNEGSISGSVIFNFNKNGLFVYFKEINGGYSYDKIKNFNIKKKVIDKFVKGSSLAKAYSFMVAANPKGEIGSKIAMSQRAAEAGRDRNEKKSVSLVEFYVGKKFFSIVLNENDYPDIKKDINLAYNNPKSFFNKSLDDWEKFSTLKKGKIFWWAYWIVAILVTGSLTSNVSEDSKGGIGFGILLLFSIYPLWQRVKLLLQGKSKVNDFKNSKDYNLALKNFK